VCRQGQRERDIFARVENVCPTFSLGRLSEPVCVSASSRYRVERAFGLCGNASLLLVVWYGVEEGERRIFDDDDHIPNEHDVVE
jgi:hypothetical protein